MSLSVQTVDSFCGLDSLLPEWTALFCRSGVDNPLAHPTWLSVWARHFVPGDALRILTARDGSGTLVGVAPYYVHRFRLPVGTIATSLQLLGTARHVSLTELPQVLVTPGQERTILRALLQSCLLSSERWDWLEISLPPVQGWFEPLWLSPDAPDTFFHLEKTTRACVTLPLPDSWETLRAGLKRNVKESIRRGANRLERSGFDYEIWKPSSDADVVEATNQLVRLHRARAAYTTRFRHPDYFADSRDRNFVRDVSAQLFLQGHATPYLLLINGEPAGGRLVVHANRTSFLSFTGLDPRWWHYSLPTTTTAAALRDAISRGDTSANFSTGPDVEKLRWSTRLEVHHEFVVVRNRLRSRLAFQAFWQARALASVRRERLRAPGAGSERGTMHD